VVKAYLNYPAGNLDVVQKIGGNQNAVINQRTIQNMKAFQETDKFLK